ncbi:MAG TPA: chromate resistance protein ChrB domain-containing protein [Candidatus Limnocylindrales bacterium]|nr:chromate resistance protein ChrB domain-containing protein [Candidatus Limnocylindrales bacterium]
MHFITRERVHVDRISTAWAIRRFIDPSATFEFVARTRDVSTLNGIPFDIRGAELGHHNGRCTFENLLERYELRDPALRRMAAIVRGADLPHEEGAPPESPGVLAVFDGIRSTATSDEERLALGAPICEALYAYCAAGLD